MKEIQYNQKIASKYYKQPDVLGGKKRLDQTKSIQRFEEAKRCLPGGLTGVRNPKAFIEGEYPIFIDHGKGCHVWDVDGNEYIDLLAGFGPTTLGIAMDEIDNAVIDRIHKGFCFSLANGLQVDLAQKIQKYFPCAENVFFCKTGTDATTIAVRLARAATGKDMILTDGYHGWNDYFQYGEDDGVLECIREKTKHIPHGNYAAYESAVTEGNVACIMVTPYMAGPMKVTKVDMTFLKKIRELCSRYKVPLIFDEIRTAFRFAMGGMSERTGIQPDMICIAKAFANGYSIAAVGGSEELMRPMIIGGRAGGTYISSTYFPNCLEMAAAIKTIDYYEEHRVVEKLADLGDYLLKGLKSAAEETGAPVVFDDEPTMPAMMFDLSNMTEEEYYARTIMLFTYLVRSGILIHPFRQLYITYSHTKEDLERVISAYREGLYLVKEKYPW